jgi:hypothetical protein
MFGTASPKSNILFRLVLWWDNVVNLRFPRSVVTPRLSGVGSVVAAGGGFRDF